MKNNKIPTAEEFLLQEGAILGENDYFEDVQAYYLIHFAKLHVKAALEAAWDKAGLDSKYDEEGNLLWARVNRKTILNAYPETLIK